MTFILILGILVFSQWKFISMCERIIFKSNLLFAYLYFMAFIHPKFSLGFVYLTRDCWFWGPIQQKKYKKILLLFYFYMKIWDKVKSKREVFYLVDVHKWRHANLNSFWTSFPRSSLYYYLSLHSCVVTKSLTLPQDFDVIYEWPHMDVNGC